jgi:hypothetical protein
MYSISYINTSILLNFYITLDWFVGIGSQSIQGNADGSAGTSSQGKKETSNFSVLLLMCERTWFYVWENKWGYMKYRHRRCCLINEYSDTYKMS